MLLGGLLLLATQSLPDIAPDVCKVAQKTSVARVQDARDLNATARRAAREDFGIDPSDDLRRRHVHDGCRSVRDV